ncbi:MAG TPA: hypothetical protein DCY27_09170 [Desulfobacterales bacterium]|nr:hypothetical protein [Desulfobacterales bacterium]
MRRNTRYLHSPKPTSKNSVKAAVPAFISEKEISKRGRLGGDEEHHHTRFWNLVALILAFSLGGQPSLAVADSIPAIVQEIQQGAEGEHGENSVGLWWCHGGNGGLGAAGPRVSSVSPNNILSSTGPIEAQDAIGVYGESIGGNGGGGGSATAEWYADGGNGGNGGNGGTVWIRNYYSIATNGDKAMGLYGSSRAGDGGSGGDALAVYAEGGNGGSGGIAGDVDIQNKDDGRITTSGTGAHGIFAQSLGGHGGAGGSGGGLWGEGGCGNSAGRGGQVTVGNYQTIQTAGDEAHGILAQSIGGFAGEGGSGGGIIGYGGDSHSGGDGYYVGVINQASISTKGKGSDAIRAQGVGGGGGSAGSGYGLVALGGQGSAGGYGGDVTVLNLVSGGGLDALGASSHGIYAQSIGGGGGSASLVAGLVAIGGDSSSTSRGGKVEVTNEGYINATANAILAQSVGGGGGDGSLAVGAVAIGGKGGGGGDGGVVIVKSTGALSSSEDNASAILAQSLGGGGGNGGSAAALGAFASFAMGGNGEKGGSGNTVTVTTNPGGDVKTQGANSHGILAQSLGGGGGNGGFAVSVSGGKYADVSVALGGSGGGGGRGNAVQVSSGTNVTTQGANAHGVLAQSLGGGGGNGGFSVAAAGSDGLSAAVAIGGKGGSGGDGGTVNVVSQAGNTIKTSGNNSSGLLAQSVGGGGGTGGFDVAASIGKFSFSMGLGGTGGSGGNANTVSLDSGAEITTSGHNAAAILAQSIGGGGGHGGFSIAASGAQMDSVSFSVGGAGGSGGAGGAVNLTSSGTIATQGKNSSGLEAQSIGGGGGDAGFSVSGSLAVGGQSSSALAISVGGKGGSGNRASEVKVFSSGASITTASDLSKGILAQSIGGGGGSGGFSGSLAISKIFSAPLSVGGDGGQGNSGGPVTVDNHSTITTSGQKSQGILAQSIGGGGGDGGFSIAGSFTYGDKSLAPSLSIGGNGGYGGDGKEVTVLSSGSAISTAGDNATALQAQSVGGGGGDGNFSAAISVSQGDYPFALADIPLLNLGCKGGGGGSAAAVKVENTSDIVTKGEEAKGILAQSVGGGGGLGSFKINGELAKGPSGITFKFGAQGAGGGGGGNAGAVTVTDSLAPSKTEKFIQTQGQNAAGILAQSVGGGGGQGGMAFGLGVNCAEGWLPEMNFVFGGDGGAGGSASDVAVQSASGISTKGDNSSGVLAQSVGGGGGDGGLAVVLSVRASPSKSKIAALSVAKGGIGGSGNRAGHVTVKSDGSEITTTGHSSTALLAQSIGGGGGSGGGAISATFGYSGAESGFSGTASLGGDGGSGGCAGAVSVTNASVLSTGATQNNEFLTGNDSSGILAQSVGGGGGSGGFSIAGLFNGSSGTANGGLAFSWGGTGGSGGTAEAVSVTNIGTSIQTLGDRSLGISAQSIGGGGGSGGFSILAGVTGGKQIINGTLSFSMGGNGGSGANAGLVTVANNSSISTGFVDPTGVHGDDSPGILAQSIGGGGGNGGFSINADVALTAAVNPSIGGKGGGGGQGKAVTIENKGNKITTKGDRSAGILAQSVGGGGGSGGFSIAGALSGGSLGVSLGGSGGSGGDGSEVKITSASSSIQTGGHDSQGILAQSIGGGGGSGGFAIDAFAGVGGVGIGIGGNGGKGGSAGAVTVTDTGALIETAGQRSAGILAQSIGGGGGSGGVGIGAGWAVMAPICIGGQDGASGNGQGMTVMSSSSITTKEDDSPAILAQSIGGGGGSGGVNMFLSKSQEVRVIVGAQKQGKGDGGAVSINTTGSTINTSGKRSTGLVAQSIGGGGGVGWAYSVCIPDGMHGSATLGGKNSSSGNGGGVSITNASQISVSGGGSHGLVAQSIGGGGGIASTLGVHADASIGGSSSASGDAGNIAIANTGTITFNNNASCGLIAQSIGGGGGLVNHTWNASELSVLSGEMAKGDGTNRGNGGTVSVVNSGDLTSTGVCAIGIAAQSLGGGGGLNMSSGQAGSAGGSGNSSDIHVTQSGTISLTGKGSVGILAQSQTGNGNAGAITIEVNKAITVQGENTTGIMAYASGTGTKGSVVVNIASGASLNVGQSGDVSSTAFKVSGENLQFNNLGTITTSGELLKLRTPPDVNACTFTNRGEIHCDSLTLGVNHTFQHLEGTHTIDKDLVFLSTPAGAAIYNLESGSLHARGILLTQGICGFNQTTGSVLIDHLNLNSYYQPTYELRNGSLTTSCIDIATQEGNMKGDFVQSGGTNKITTELVLGGYSGNVGNYYLKGGELQANKITVKEGGNIYRSSGDLSCNTLDIGSGGLFAGSGFMQGAVTNSGSFHVTSLSEAGDAAAYTLALSGCYNNDAGGTLIIDIASATEYGRLAVTGTPGTVQLAQDAADILEPRLLPSTFRPRGNQVFADIVTSTGELIGKFDEIVNHPTLSWEAVYHANSVDLIVHRDYTNPSLGLNPNQLAVGNVLNRVTDVTTGDLAIALNAVDYLTDNAGVRHAYQQISPDKAAALSNLAFAGASFQMRQQAQRLTDLRFGPRGGGPAADGFGALRLNYSSLQGLMLAYNSASLAGLLTPRPGTAAEKPWGFYLYPSLVLGSQQSSLNQTGYNFNMAGFTTGADCWLGDNLVLGLATGYSHTDADFKGSGGNVATNTWPLTAYAAYLGRSWYTYGSLGYALNLFDLERNLAFGGLQRTAKSSPTGHQLNAYGEAGYDVKAKNLIITPMASLAYSGLWIDSYQESGAGALNLQVGGQSADSLQTGVGLKVAAPVKRAAFTLVPQVYASYQHEFANGSRGLNASLSQAGTTFAFRTDAAQRDFAVVGAKVDLVTRKNVQIGVNYNAEVGRGNSTAHAVYAGVRWQF